MQKSNQVDCIDRKHRKQDDEKLQQPKIFQYFTSHNMTNGVYSSSILNNELNKQEQLCLKNTSNTTRVNRDLKTCNHDTGHGHRGSGGVCFAFQRGECSRGTDCRYSHTIEFPSNRNNKRIRSSSYKYEDVDNYIDEGQNAFHKNHFQSTGDGHIMDIAALDVGYESNHNQQPSALESKSTTSAFNVRDFISKEANKKDVGNVSVSADSNNVILNAYKSYNLAPNSSDADPINQGLNKYVATTHDPGIKIGDLFNDVSIDTFYFQLFKTCLSYYCNNHSSTSCTDDRSTSFVEEFKARYLNEEQYIKTYETMLLHEVKSAISQTIDILSLSSFQYAFLSTASVSNNDYNNNRTLNHSRRLSSNIQSSLFQSLECVSIQNRKVADLNISTKYQETVLLEVTFSLVAPSSVDSTTEKYKIIINNNSNDSNNKNNSSFNNCSANSNLVVQKEDLVVVVRRKSCHSHRNNNNNNENTNYKISHGNSNSNNNNESKGWTIEEILKRRHILGIVIAVNNSMFNTRGSTPSVANIDIESLAAAGSDSDSSSCTLLIRPYSSQELNETESTKLRFSTGHIYDVIPLMSMSTFIREWMALHSITNHRLMPLTPYILKSSPVVSAMRLEEINNNIKSQLRTIEHLKKHSSATLEIQQSRLDNALASLLKEFIYLDTVQVDGSVLRNTNTSLIQTLNNLKINAENDSTLTIIQQRSSELLKKWKSSIKMDNKLSTIRNMKGGNVLAVPPDSDNVDCPSGVSQSLWDYLSSQYNNSQLYAIKYVSDVLDTTQDTRIALVQGPPGTGKSFTILGMIAALLHGRETSTSGSSSLQYNENNNLNSRSQHRILLCAPSNAAVDELLTKLLRNGLPDSKGKQRVVKMIRMGESTPDCPSYIRELSLEYQTELEVKQSAHWLTFQIYCDRIESLLKTILELNQNQHQNQGSMTNSTKDNKTKNKEMEQLRNARNELYQVKKQRSHILSIIDRYRIDVRRNLIYDADIVVSTLSSSGKQIFLDHIIRDDLRFETALIDEAAQATEPSTLIPLRYGCRRLVLVGDPRQLPATVLSPTAERLGLGVSLFERLERAGHALVMLTCQYRMMPEIRRFPSDYFYQSKLIDSESVRQIACKITSSTPSSDIQHMISAYKNKNISSNNNSNINISSSKLNRFEQLPQQLTINFPIQMHSSVQSKTKLLINPNGIMFYDLKSSQEVLIGKSYKNDVEIDFIVSILEALSKQYTKVLNDFSIGIISSYKAQVTAIKNRLKSLNTVTNTQATDDMSITKGITELTSSSKNALQLPYIEVNTVDGFQGKEKDIIIFSCVRSGPNGIGFLNDEKRVNVAITRGKYKLLIVGQMQTLNTSHVWSSLLSSLVERNYVQQIDS